MPEWMVEMKGTWMVDIFFLFFYFSFDFFQIDRSYSKIHIVIVVVTSNILASSYKEKLFIYLYVVFWKMKRGKGIRPWNRCVFRPASQYHYYI